MTDIRDEIINRWKELGEKAALLPCPRCGHLKMDKDLYHNALSRRVDLYVCSSCGTEEAMEDYNGRKKPFEEWFVFTELFGSQAPVRETADEEFKLNVQRQIIVTKEDVDDIVNRLVMTMFDFGLREIEEAVKDRLAELNDTEETEGELSEEEQEEREALETLEPFDDMQSFHNFIDTHIWIDAKEKVPAYTKYLKEALDHFCEMTGFEITY